jgi:hypothetical protein
MSLLPPLPGPSGGKRPADRSLVPLLDRLTKEQRQLWGLPAHPVTAAAVPARDMAGSSRRHTGLVKAQRQQEPKLKPGWMEVLGSVVFFFGQSCSFRSAETWEAKSSEYPQVLRFGGECSVVIQTLSWAIWQSVPSLTATMRKPQ